MCRCNNCWDIVHMSPNLIQTWWPSTTDESSQNTSHVEPTEITKTSDKKNTNPATIEQNIQIISMTSSQTTPTFLQTTKLSLIQILPIS